MMSKSEIDRLWMDLKPVPGAKFKLNDNVIFIDNDFANKVGAVISLIELLPEPVYIVELLEPPYGDIKIKETSLEKA